MSLGEQEGDVGHYGGEAYWPLWRNLEAGGHKVVELLCISPIASACAG